MEVNNGPPPRPSIGSNKRSTAASKEAHLKKRQQFALNRRHRSLSNGSTRGAFGPMDVNDAHNDKEIYEVQKAAMNNNLRNINVPSSHSHGHGQAKVGSTKKHTTHGHGHHRRAGHHQDDEEYARKSPEKKYESNGNGYGSAPVPGHGHHRRPSADANTNFAFSHHSPTYNDIKVKAAQEAEIQKFSKYSGYGTQNNSWDEDSFESASISDENEHVSYIHQFVRTVFYDHTKPEFTSLQQSSWAVLIGIFMGFLTAVWGMTVEYLVEFFWSTLPEYLLEQGIFTGLDGHLPLPHYMWICPTIFGGVSRFFFRSKSYSYVSLY